MANQRVDWYLLQVKVFLVINKQIVYIRNNINEIVCHFDCTAGHVVWPRFWLRNLQTHLLGKAAGSLEILTLPYLFIFFIVYAFWAHINWNMLSEYGFAIWCLLYFAAGILHYHVKINKRSKAHSSWHAFSLFSFNYSALKCRHHLTL